MNHERNATTAAKGMDTQDLLDHIAWTDVIKPKLEEARITLTDRLVAATLNPQAPHSETKEQLAGKLWGIQFITQTLEKILKEGARAKEALAAENLFLQ